MMIPFKHVLPLPIPDPTDLLSSINLIHVRDQRSPKNSVVFLKQSSGKHKGLRRQIAKRSELPRVIVRRQAPALDLISHFGDHAGSRLRGITPDAGVRSAGGRTPAPYRPCNDYA